MSCVGDLSINQSLTLIMELYELCRGFVHKPVTDINNGIV